MTIPGYLARTESELETAMNSFAEGRLKDEHWSAESQRGTITYWDGGTRYVLTPECLTLPSEAGSHQNHPVTFSPSNSCFTIRRILGERGEFLVTVGEKTNEGRRAIKWKVS